MRQAKGNRRKRTVEPNGRATGGGNQRTLRASNRTLVLNLIRLLQPVSRVDLARRSGLTKGTVSNITNRLIEEGLLQEISVGQSTGGRPPTLLKLAADRNLLGAVEIRPGLTTLAVATLDGTILRRATVETHEEHPEVFLATCARQVYGMLKQFGDRHVVGVGLTVPGTVSRDRQRIVTAFDLGWNDVSIERAARQLEWPLILENDANAAALAELYYGTEPVTEDLVSIVLNDSLGGGIVVGRRLFRGTTGQAGEIGHTTIDVHGAPCACGRPGCLGSYASARGVVERYKMLRQREHAAGLPVQPVRQLQAKPAPRGVRLHWADAADASRRYEIFRSADLPVPTDAAHAVGSTVRTTFLDEPGTGDVQHYAVVAVDMDGRRSVVSAPVACQAGPPDVLLDDRFPEAPLARYVVQATVPPQPGPHGLDLGSETQDYQSTQLWRGAVDTAIVTGTVEPLVSGVYDTCGVLVKVQDAEHWYCALLAYGDQLAAGHTLSVMRQSGQGDEWLAFYPISVQMNRPYTIQVWVADPWIRVKAWPAGESPPDEWQLSIRDDTGWKGGGVGFRCYGKRVRLHRLHAEVREVPDREDPLAAADTRHQAEPALRIILEQARQGDATARHVLAETGRYLGLGISNVSAVLGIRRYRLSGRLVEGWDAMQAPLEGVLSKTIVPADCLDVRPSMLGPQAGLLGAVCVASLPLFEGETEI